MDIVVTIPKKEYKNDEKETNFLKENKDSYQFWGISKMPKKLQKGDRVYFIKNNRIDSSMKVKDMQKDSPEFCEVTKRVWDNKVTIYLNDMRKESLDINIKGFQGFRYKWW
jgi:hypothetical protein